MNWVDLLNQQGQVVGKLGADQNYLDHLYQRTEFTSNSALPIGYAASMFAARHLPADVGLPTSSAWVTALSLPVPSGVWAVNAYCTIRRDATGLARYAMRVGSASGTLIATTGASHPSQNPHMVSLHVSGLLYVVQQETIQMQCLTSAGSVSTFVSAAAESSAGATGIMAVRLS